jgi:hypothetical protein
MSGIMSDAEVERRRELKRQLIDKYAAEQIKFGYGASLAIDCGDWIALRRRVAELEAVLESLVAYWDDDYVGEAAIGKIEATIRAALAPERAERGEGARCDVAGCGRGDPCPEHDSRQPAPPASGAPRCANGHVLGKGPHFCDACDCACSVHPSGGCDCDCRRHPREET